MFYIDKKEIRETLKLSWPVSLGQLGHIMLGVVDSLMVGHVSASALAASSLVNGIFFLVIVLGIGMTMAVTPLVSIAKSSGKTGECKSILLNAIYVNLTLAIILTLIIYFLSYTLPYLGQQTEVEVLAQSYMKILAYSIIPFLIFQTFRQFIEGLSITKPTMYIAIIANIINAIGNWILIFGKFGIPALGLDGAGYATFITRLFIMMSVIFYALYSVNVKNYLPVRFWGKLNSYLVKKIIQIGFPSGLMYMMEVGAFAFSAVMIGWLGSEQLAAHQIAISLASISYMIILGISTAGTIRVGNAVGQKDFKQIKRAGISALLLGASFMSVSAIIFVLFNKLLPTLYISNVNVISIASQLLIVAAIFQLSDGLQAVGSGILRGLTDVKIPLYVTIFSYWIIGIPVGYLLGFIAGFGVLGIWVGLLIGLTLAASLFVIRFIKLSGKMFYNLTSEIQ